MQLSKNFALKEFTKIDWAKIPKRGQDMLKAMADMLQIVRDSLNKPLVVNSAVRDMDDYNRLKKNGYNPSKTSDHFYWNTPDGYLLAVGAADVVCPSMKQTDFYNEVLKLKYAGKIKPGQLLYEKSKPASLGWCHIANNTDVFLTADQKKKRSEFSLKGNGYSINNGVDWKILQPGQFLPSNL